MNRNSKICCKEYGTVFLLDVLYRAKSLRMVIRARQQAVNSPTRCAHSCFNAAVENLPPKRFFKTFKGNASTSEAPLTGPSWSGDGGHAEPIGTRQQEEQQIL